MKLSDNWQDKLRIETPFIRHNLTVFPLIDETSPATADYLAFGAAHRAGAIRITEVSEGGSVPQLAVEIIGESAVLLLDGEELIGALQNRIVNLTILAKGKTKIVIPVSCVEHGRWSYQSREFSESPRTMYSRGRMKKTMNVSASLKNSGMRCSDQSEVWDDVDRMASELRSHSPTGAMGAIFDQQATSVEEYLHQLDFKDGQVGAAFAIDGQVVGVEVFESQDIARQYLPKIVRSYALDAIARRSTRIADVNTTADTAQVSGLIREICEAESQSFPAVGIGEDLRIDSKDLTGAALLRDGSVVHLSAFRKVLDEAPSGGARKTGRSSGRSGESGAGSGTAPVAGGRAGSRTASTGQSERYPIEIVRDHILIRIGGKRALIDTGSPLSFGRGQVLSLEGRNWNPSSANGFILDAVRDHLGTEVDWLVGGDILKRHRLLLDWPRRVAHVGRARTRHIADRFPMELVMGVPVISAGHQGREIRGVLDSGAALSYAPMSALRGLPESGEHRDFYPGVGEFTTRTWEVPVIFGGRDVLLRVGVLPSALQMLFGMILGPDGWILGSGFFRDRAMLLDYRWKHVLDLSTAARV